MTGVLTKAGKFTNTDGPDTITGIGFTPVAVILWMTMYPTGQVNDAWEQTSYLGVGFSAYNGSTYTHGGVCASSLYKSSGNTACERAGSGALSVDVYDTTGYQDFGGSVTAMASGQFTVTWSQDVGTGYTINYLAIGGDVSKAYVKAWQGQAGTGVQAVGGVGFQPAMCIHIGAELTSATNSGNAALCFGVMDGTNQWATYIASKSGVATSATERVMVTDGCIVGTNNTTAIVQKAAYSAFGADGFSVNWASALTNVYYYTLCLYNATAGEMVAGNYTKSTGGNGSTNVITTSMTTVTGLLNATVSYTTVGAEVAGSRFCLGADDGTNHVCVAETDKNAQGTGVKPAYGYNSTLKSILVANNDSAPTTTEAIGSTGFSTNQFTTTWSTNNAVATYIGYIAFGAAASASTYTEGTPPNVSVATVAPTLGETTNIVQGTPKDVSVATSALTKGLAVTPASINVAAATSALTIGEASNIVFPTPQNVAVATSALTIAGVSNIVLPTPQNVAVAASALTKGIGKSPASIDVAVAVSGLTKGIGVSPASINVAATTVAPTISGTSNIVLPTPQNVAAAVSALTTGIGKSPASIDVAVAVSALTKGIGISPASINVAAATVAPTISGTSNIVLPTPQNVAVATSALTKGLGITQVTPANVAADIVAITKGLGVSLSSINVAAATVAPTIAGTSNILLPTPQDVSVTTVSPAIGASSNIVFPTPQDIAATIVAPVVTAVSGAGGATWIESTVPNIGVATVAPVISSASNIVLPTPQDVSAVVSALLKGIAITEATPANVAADIVAITKGIGVTQLTSPNVAVATSSPTIATSSNITPGVLNVAASVNPVIVTVSTAGGFTQIIVPNVAAAIGTVIKGLAIAQGVPPAVAVSVVAPSIGLSIAQPLVPNVAITANKPTVGSGVIPTVPNVTSTAVAPTIAASSNIVQAVVPNVVVDINKPTITRRTFTDELLIEVGPASETLVEVTNTLSETLPEPGADLATLTEQTRTYNMTLLESDEERMVVVEA